MEAIKIAVMFLIPALFASFALWGVSRSIEQALQGFAG